MCGVINRYQSRRAYIAWPSAVLCCQDSNGDGNETIVNNDFPDEEAQNSDGDVAIDDDVAVNGAGNRCPEGPETDSDRAEFQNSENGGLKSCTGSEGPEQDDDDNDVTLDKDDSEAADSGAPGKGVSSGSGSGV